MKDTCRLAFRLTVVVALAACGAPQLPTSGAHAPLADGTQRAACGDDPASDERLVVDWPPLERAKLEAASRRGVIMVHVTGCTARVVETCRSRQRYEYVPTSRQREVTTLHDVDELRAKLPLGAVRFGASLERASSLAVTMTIVGRYESPAIVDAAREVEGQCDDVTHVVSSVTVGSFEIATTTEERMAASAEAMIAEGHARRDATRRHLDSAGVEASCADSRRTDAAPPDGCGIPLRLDLRRFGAPPTTTAARAEAGANAQPRDAAFDARAKGAILPCYRQALALDRNLAGSLTLIVTVGQGGNVKSVSSKYDVPDTLAECASARIERVTFSTTEETQPRVFVVPLVFHAKTL